ncbi:MAG: cation-translocating P-type ATPase [Candidatus Scalindua sediminis]|nr:cation-translocating P-type ATPase [Candidatus Scalindua sediminis]
MSENNLYCEHCKLPIGGSFIRACNKENNKDTFFCCYGCKLVHELVSGKGGDSESSWLLAKLGLVAFLTMNVMILSLLLYSDYFRTIDIQAIRNINYLLFGLTTPVILLIVIPFFKSVIKSTNSLYLNTDSLIVMGSLSAYFYSTYSTFTNRGYIYFDTAAIVILLFTLGKFLEATAKAKITRSITESIGPTISNATIIKDGMKKDVPVEEVNKGDYVVVQEGNKIPVDGPIVEGYSNIDESMITGESGYTIKKTGDYVYSGSMVLDGRILIEAKGVGKDSLLSKITKIITNAQMSNSPIRRISDRIAGLMVPAVIIAASLVFAFWYLKGENNEAIMNSIAVLVVACPCAFGIATPLAVCVGIGRGLKENVFFRDGAVFEKLPRTSTVAFDKTGTLTYGKLYPVSLAFDENKVKNREEFLSILASIELCSNHPLSKSITEMVQNEGIQIDSALSFKSYSGRGIEGQVGERFVVAGNKKFMEEKSMKITPYILQKQNGSSLKEKTTVYCAWDGEVKGVIGFKDPLRADALSTINSLKEMGLKTILLSGDNENVVEDVAIKTGMDSSKGFLLPDEKLNEIKKLKNCGKKVLMVGDGINDAPALSTADVGIAVGSGTDIVNENSDVSIIDSELKRIPWAIRFTKEVRKKIIGNIAWATGYNSIGIYLAATGMLRPIFAALMMVVSSLFVISNSLRLQRFKGI